MDTKKISHSGLPILPLSWPDATGMDASGFVCALVGSPSVTLGGFKSEKLQKGLLFHPAIPFVDARHFDETLNISSFRRKAWLRLAMFGGAVIVFCAALSIGILGSQYTDQFFEKQTVAASHVSPNWSIVDVVPAGILLSVNAGPPFFIAVGSSLPNGDSVVSVSHEQKMIFLASSTVMLRGALTPKLSTLKDAND